MKTWWARIGDQHDAYGRWVPKGCADKEAAREYMSTYPGS